MKNILILLSVALLCGCASFEKKHYKAVKFFNENENLAAEYCSGKFPSVIEFIKGDEIIKTDTVYQKEPVFIECPDGSKKECPEQKTIYKTIYRTDTIKKPNTAYETVLKNEIQEYKSKYYKEQINVENAVTKQKEAEKSARTYKILFFSLLGLVAAFVIFRIVK